MIAVFSSLCCSARFLDALAFLETMALNLYTFRLAGVKFIYVSFGCGFVWLLVCVNGIDESQLAVSCIDRAALVLLLYSSRLLSCALVIQPPGFDLIRSSYYIRSSCYKMIDAVFEVLFFSVSRPMSSHSCPIYFLDLFQMPPKPSILS
jgi:hypothetical protein